MATSNPASTEALGLHHPEQHWAQAQAYTTPLPQPLQKGGYQNQTGGGTGLIPASLLPPPLLKRWHWTVLCHVLSCCLHRRGGTRTGPAPQPLPLGPPWLAWRHRLAGSTPHPWSFRKVIWNDIGRSFGSLV